MSNARNKRQKRDDQAVKIERALAKIANIIAQNREISAAELLSDLLRIPLEKEWQKELKKLNEQRRASRPADPDLDA